MKKTEKPLSKQPKKRTSHNQNILKGRDSVFENKTILELKKFQENCVSFTRNEIFKKIGELDKKYTNDLNYWNNVDGTIANIIRDRKILEQARKIAFKLIQKDYDLKLDKNKPLLRKYQRKYKQREKLFSF